MLHTRSTKYGLLSQGRIIKVPAELVRRQRHHFQHLENVGVDIILGCNGLVWVTHHVDAQPLLSHQQQQQQGGEKLTEEQKRQQQQQREPTAAQRESVSRVGQCILALAQLGLALQGTALARVVQLSLEKRMAPKFILESEFLSAVAAEEEIQRQEGIVGMEA